MCRADELSLRREANGKVTGEFIVRSYAIPNLVKSVIKEVHIVFDRPAGNLHTPKALEESRRDPKHSVSTNHEHYQFTDSASVPRRWREHLNCFTVSLSWLSTWVKHSSH